MISFCPQKKEGCTGCLCSGCGPATIHIFKAGEDGIEQQRRIGIEVLVQFGLSLGIDDADVHFPCMQIDAAIKFVTLIVKSHGLPPLIVQCVNGSRINNLHCRFKGGNQVRYFPAENGPIE